MTRGKLCLMAILALASYRPYAQAINSPYSGNGVGEMLFQGLPQNVSMGGLGVGTPSSWHINLQNPALLTYNRLTSFAVGVESDFRRFRSVSGSVRESGIGLRYLALSLPLVENSIWITSVALMPLSTVNYHTVSFDAVEPGVTAQTDFLGEGGLSQVIWSNGFRVAKDLSIGFKAAYVFGQITEESNIKIGPDTLVRDAAYLTPFAISYQESTTYADYTLEIGGSYRIRFGEKKWINTGVTFRPATMLKGERSTVYERQTLRGQGFTRQELNGEERARFELPQSISLGLSYEKFGKYKFGVDFHAQQWTKTNTQEQGEELRNTFNLAVGGEFVPNYQSLKSYLARSVYRVGVSYKQSPYVLNGIEINDFGINFGISLPMGGASSLETAFKIGVRGTTQNNLVRENYFQFILGATINDRWFIKRRYD